MRLTTNEKQSLAAQLLGTGGWRPPTDERAAEIEAMFNAHDEAVRQDKLKGFKYLRHMNNQE